MSPCRLRPCLRSASTKKRFGCSWCISFAANDECFLLEPALFQKRKQREKCLHQRGVALLFGKGFLQVSCFLLKLLRGFVGGK